MSCQSTVNFFRGCVHYLLVLINAGLLCIPGAVSAQDSPSKLLFTGDILLTRQVAREITHRKGLSPWANLQPLFKNVDWIIGNFEGSVGSPTNCVGKDKTLCFAVQAQTLAYLKQAGFSAVTIANNHSADLGKKGKAATRFLLKAAGVPALDFKHSPGFFKINDNIIAIIALTNVSGQDGKKITIPSNSLRQKIRLAQSLSDWVIVSIHWGVELSEWPNAKQRKMAIWLIKQGADVIIGHHPHVVQAPECIMAHPVFFSLGNHVFDQKYFETKQGLIAECTIQKDKLSCSGIKTKTPNNSAFPEPLANQPKVKQAIENCAVPKRSPIQINGYVIRPKVANTQLVDGDLTLEGKRATGEHWVIVARHLLSLTKGYFVQGVSGKEFLFTLENHLSDMDQEISPRPYVYEVGAHGLIARWRGSALSWPLVDAVLIGANHGVERKTKPDYLCALHRKDAFITLNRHIKATRTAVYQWNDFGFNGVKEEYLIKQCQHAFD